MYVHSAIHSLTTIAELDIIHISTMHISHRLRKSIKQRGVYEHGVISWSHIMFIGKIWFSVNTYPYVLAKFIS